jgi:hypothetical protein
MNNLSGVYVERISNAVVASGGELAADGICELVHTVCHVNDEPDVENAMPFANHGYWNS